MCYNIKKEKLIRSLLESGVFMIKLFSVPTGSSSAKKAKTWLIENHIEFEEFNIRAYSFTKSELLHLFSLTDTGIKELISTRCRTFKKLKLNINNLDINTSVELILEHPALLKEPIIVSDNQLQVGFNEDEIRVFIPRSVRRLQLKSLCEHVYKNETN